MWKPIRIKKKYKPRRIAEVVTKDGINVIGFLYGIPTPLEIPKEVIKEVIRRIKEGSPSNFVDWRPKDWSQTYSDELNSAVKLFYKGKGYILPDVLILDNIEHKLDLSQISFKLEKKSFELDNDVRALTEVPFKQLKEYLSKKDYSNDTHLKLIKIIEGEDRVILQVQPVNYEHFMHTNLVLDAGGGKAQTLRDWIHPNGKLEELDKSRLADHLGVNILLFTADGRLIMQKRSRKVAFRTNELCPAASGAIDFGDVQDKINLKNMHKLREAWEEIGICPSDIPIDQIFFLGITRELILGGKPGMVFFGKTNLSEKQIEEKLKNAKDKWESDELIFFNFGQIAHKDLDNVMEKHKFLCKVDEYLDEYLDEFSIPLMTAVSLWVKWRIYDK